ncbi:PREDICTED: subtilisin-like protease SBT4.13 [Camelina sativa]|uniref:Subtilisin-like protease SBT4.13 n=1 Tax=Camelina sativa TaxID=90675 RepID=A0ABM0UNB0_CAMSA|nr:PREDICTED: subtilisin-like protease SBT4.13 [Camelina sativa]
MAKVAATSSCLLSCLLVLFLSSVSAVTDEDKKVYIVYMGSLPSRADYSPIAHHMSILQEVTGESSIQGRLVRSYQRSFNGFAARLTESERERVADMEGVVSVFPNKKLQLHTTTSWDFMGLKEGTRTKRNPTVESDTIIGVLDSGITPESQSFSDEGFGPPPEKWKGVCSGGKNFTCNNKLIGARDYTSEGARDTDGDGTHTSSTAAGNAVVDTSFFGIGNGTVRGGVPASRIAAYKVCNESGCYPDALLDAFGDAIADGVDLFSISIGGDETASMFEFDSIAIGAFHAMAKGILTVNSGGNSGPNPTSVSSVAPWILTVAASTTNRGFVTKVVLGNGKTLVGKSVNSFDMKGKNYPLVYGKPAASSTCDAAAAELCKEACLDKSRVNGKILVCGGRDGLKIAESVGASGIIFRNPRPDVAHVHPLLASGLLTEDFESLVTYLESTNSPQATILKTETIFNRTSPVIASFSSRGPNTIAVDILKPDITAPGVEILAAYSPDGAPSKNDARHVKYSVLSGTSMSCPHVAGVAAYVKTFNPKWSPSMIQSAIMTTAWPVNATGTGIASTEFAYGAGHVDPIAAVNPGLVYELDKADHIAFLCGMNYTSEDLKVICGETVTCSEEKEFLPRNLNYPSMSAKLSGSDSNFTVTFNRTLTNVGTPSSTYTSKVVAGHGSELSIKVTPSVLSFKTVNEKQSFEVTVTGNDVDSEVPSSANLIWSDGIHNVRSPIVVYSYTNDEY